MNKKFIFQFTGREVGAIGCFGIYTRSIEASSEEYAKHKIYETHEHISDLIIVEIIDGRAIVRQHRDGTRVNN